MASKRAKVLLGAGLGLFGTAAAIIQPWEGLVLKSHWDPYAKIWDICYGETKGITKGMTKTKAECEQMFTARLEKDFYKPISKCVSNFDRLPMSVRVTSLSLGYNIGVGAFCKSTAARLMRDWKLKEACHAMTRFNRAGGQVVNGLVKRREWGDKTRIGELELCLEGLPK